MNKKTNLSQLETKKANYAHILLSVQTAKAIIKSTLTNVPFGGTASIPNGTTRNNKNFVKTEGS